MKEWLSIASRREVVVRSLKVGVFIGTILTAVNQGDMIVSGQFASSAAWKITLTYLVPFCVSTYVSVDSIRRHENPNSGS